MKGVNLTESIEISQIKSWQFDHKASQNTDKRFIEFARSMARIAAQEDYERELRQEPDKTIH